MGERRSTLDQLLDGLLGKKVSPTDWSALIGLASETLTIGTLAEQLLEGESDALPADVEDLLSDVRARARERNSRMKTQLAEALPTLNGAGIRPIVMRGMARLLGAKPDPARLSSDIDLLIAPEELEPCVSALRSIGYRWMRGDGERFPLVFGRSQDVGSIDVHTDLEPAWLKLDRERIAAECRLVRLGEGELLLPSPACQLYFITLHDELHDGDYWRGLIDTRHLVDVAALVEEGVDWDALERFLPQGLPRRALEVQLRTAHRLVGIEVPARLCGGLWAKVQARRRRFQARRPWLMRPLTLISMAAERPPRAPIRRLREEQASDPAWSRWPRRLSEYLRAPNSGKLRLG